MTSSGVQGADRACCNLIAGRVGDDLQLGGANGGALTRIRLTWVDSVDQKVIEGFF